MRQLLKNGIKLKWSKACSEEFLTTVIDIVHALEGFDPNLDSCITTDASGKGLGAVLSQRDDQGKELIISFASRALTPTENRYPAIEREALACAWALNHFRAFVWGKPVTIFCDHKPLVKLLTTDGTVNASARIARLSIRMQDFIHKVVYLPGKDNILADCLSRLPLRLEECEDDNYDDFQVAFVHDDGGCAVSREWAMECNEDDILQFVKECIRDNWLAKSKCNDKLRPFWEIRSQLSIENDTILRGERLVPPLGLQETIIHLCHDGHFGIGRTKNVVRGLFWWPGVDADVERYVRKCMTCSTADKILQTLRLPMLEYTPPLGLWDSVAIDLFGPVGNDLKYVIVLMDLFSKWPVVEVID